jgi:hypothetical protein
MTSWFCGRAGSLGLLGRAAPGLQDPARPEPEALFSGRVVDTGGSPIAGARVLAVPSRTPVPPKLEEASTGADGTFLLGGLRGGFYKLFIIGPDGTWTLAGMVNGDPATATEFETEFFDGIPIDVGDLTLGGP